MLRRPCEAAQADRHLRTRGPAARRRRQGHLRVQRRELRRLGGGRRRRHVLRRQCRLLRRERRARSRRSITAAPGASGTRSWSPTRSSGGIHQARVAHERSNGEGRIHMNVLWEMAAAERVLHGVLEGAKGPHPRRHLRRRHALQDRRDLRAATASTTTRSCPRPAPSARCGSAPITSSRDWLGGVVYEDPWLAGGHNGLSNSEDPRSPERALSARRASCAA